ncbi:hypothetical protein [Siminovitchia terrae]|nr:hypothetical protein [Siminovitchia terrae]
MNAYWYSIQWGFKPRLNKIWAQIRQGAFDSGNQIFTNYVK